MKRFFMTVVVLSVMALLLTSVAQADSKGRGFIGIWQVVSGNGQLVTTDISDIDGDGEFRYRVNIDFSSACNEPGELGRLVITPLAPATINADGDFIVNIMQTCLFTGRVIEENTEVIYRRIEDNIILNVTRDDPFQRVSIPTPNRSIITFTPRTPRK